MTPEQILPGIRLIEMTLWALIVVYHWRAVMEVLREGFAASREQWLIAILWGVGAATLSLQIRSLAGVAPLRHDWWTVWSLVGLMVPAIAFTVREAHETPPGNRRAFILSRLAIVALCIAAGGLMWDG